MKAEFLFKPQISLPLQKTASGFVDFCVRNITQADKGRELIKAAEKGDAGEVVWHGGGTVWHCDMAWGYGMGIWHGDMAWWWHSVTRWCGMVVA